MPWQMIDRVSEVVNLKNDAEDLVLLFFSIKIVSYQR